MKEAERETQEEGGPPEEAAKQGEAARYDSQGPALAIVTTWRAWSAVNLSDWPRKRSMAHVAAPSPGASVDIPTIPPRS